MCVCVCVRVRVRVRVATGVIDLVLFVTFIAQTLDFCVCPLSLYSCTVCPLFSLCTYHDYDI